MRKLQQDNNEPAIPGVVRVTNGENSGEMYVALAKVKNAGVYYFQFSNRPITNATDGKTIFSIERKCTITGLTPGEKYWLRVAAANANGAVNYSNVIVNICP